MIGQSFYIDKYDWQIVVLYEVSYNNKDYVMDMLRKICEDDKLIAKGETNHCFTNQSGLPIRLNKECFELDEKLKLELTND